MICNKHPCNEEADWHVSFPEHSTDVYYVCDSHLGEAIEAIRDSIDESIAVRLIPVRELVE